MLKFIFDGFKTQFLLNKNSFPKQYRNRRVVTEFFMR